MIESKYLKENIENIQRLMTISALKHFETRNLGKLLRLSKIRQYEDGETIIQEGDLDPWLYFLLSGEVEVSKEGEAITRLSKKGEIFGEMRVIDDQIRSATVRSSSRSTSIRRVFCEGALYECSRSSSAKHNPVVNFSKRQRLRRIRERRNVLFREIE